MSDMLICTLTVPQDNSGMSCPKGLKRASFDVGVIAVVAVVGMRQMIKQQQNLNIVCKLILILEHRIKIMVIGF